MRAAPTWLRCRCGWLLRPGRLVSLMRHLLFHQWAQLDVTKQAGQWTRLHKQVRAAEEHLRQGEQHMLSSPAQPPECANKAEYAKTPVYAKQQEEQNADPPSPTTTTADERQERLHAVAEDLLYWKGGLKVLRQARLPKWRGSFKWQIEAKVEALQAAYATVRAEAVKSDG